MGETQRLSRAVQGAALVLVSVLYLFPFVWMVNASLKDTGQAVPTPFSPPRFGTGLFRLEVIDLLKPSAFATALKEGKDPLAARLRDRLAKEARGLLDAYAFPARPDPALLRALADDLNRQMAEAPLGEALSAGQLGKLPEAVRGPARSAPPGDASLRANRAVLEAVYPDWVRPHRSLLSNYSDSVEDMGKFYTDRYVDEEKLEGEKDAARQGELRAALQRKGRRAGFLRVVFNSVLITGLSIVFQILTCSMAGYGFARMRFRGRGPLFVLILATMMLPVQVTVIPQFVLFQQLGWIDTYLPILAPALLGGNPFFIFLFRQFFLTVPKDVVEAARLDGCGWFGIYWRVMLPLARPAAAAVAIFTFVWTWNDLWLPLIYLNSPEKATMTLALTEFQRSFQLSVEKLMAASTLAILPCILIYFLAQKYFVRGVQLTAGKG